MSKDDEHHFEVVTPTLEPPDEGYTPLPPSAVISHVEAALDAGNARDEIITAAVDALTPWTKEQRFRLLSEAAAQQSLLAVEAAVAADACSEASGSQLVQLMESIMAWSATLKSRTARDNFFFRPASRGTGDALLSGAFRSQEGPVLKERGVKRLLEVVRSHSPEVFELDDGQKPAHDYVGFTARTSEVNAITTEMGAPFLREVIRCGGRRPRVDATDAAVELALWGSVELVQLLVKSGYSIANATFARSRTRWERMSHPLASYSVAHAAAWAGQELVLEYLERALPQLSLVRDERYGISARELLWHPEAVLAAASVSDTDGMDSGLVESLPSGGWPIDEVEAPVDVEQAGCSNIDIVPASSVRNASVFVSTYLLRRRPVLLRGALYGSSVDPALAPWAGMWTREALLKLLGDTKWHASRRFPYEREYLPKDMQDLEQMTLRDFVEHHLPPARLRDPPRNIFDAIFFDGDGETVQVAEIETIAKQAPWWARDLVLSYPQLYLGPPKSGANFHHHNAAWNLLAFGRKLWLLTPPQDAAFSTRSAAQSLVEELSKLRRVRGCRLVDQRAGDVLVLPERWGHLTYNLRTSVGMAQEFHLG